MKNIFLGILIGGLLTWRFFIVYPIDTPFTRCYGKFMFDAEIYETDPNIQKTIKKENFSSYSELVKDRCNYWIKNM